MLQRLLVVVLTFTALSGALAQASPCDRGCMIALVDQYLAALVKHDPAGLPLSRGVRFTENTAEIRIGDGLWVAASEAPTTFKIYAVDPGTSQVAFYGVMKEWDKLLIIALRLKVIRGESTEIEHGLARERHENGGQTTHNKTPVQWPVDLGSAEANRSMAIIGTLSCTAQVDSRVLSFITRLWPRRLTVVDEQKGLVFAFPKFNHRGGVRTIKVGVPRSGYDSNGRRYVESAGRGDFQDPGREDPRDRGHGRVPALWDEERLGVDPLFLTFLVRPYSADAPA